MAWIDARLTPPPAHEKVLVVCRTKKGVQNINIGYFDLNGVFHGMGSSAGVTHWMRLPKLP